MGSFRVAYTLARTLQVLCSCFEGCVHREVGGVKTRWFIGPISDYYICIVIRHIYEPFQWNCPHLLGCSGVVVHVDAAIDNGVIAQ